MRRFRRHWNDESPDLQVPSLLEAWRVAVVDLKRPELLELVPVVSGAGPPHWRSRKTQEVPQSPGSHQLAALLVSAKSADEQALIWVSAAAQVLMDQAGPDAFKMMSWLLWNVSQKVPEVMKWDRPCTDRGTFPRLVSTFRFATVPQVPKALVTFAAIEAGSALTDFDLIS